MMWALISSRPSSKTWKRPTGPAQTMTASVSMASGLISTACMRSADQFGQLARLVLPLVGVGQGGLAPGDAGPVLGQVGIDLDHVDLIARHILLRHDGVDRALGDAHGAIDALVGVD